MESMEKEFQTLIEKKLMEQHREQNKEIHKKVLKTRLFLLVFELVLNITGWTIIGYNCGIWITLGLFIAMWGNNMSQCRTMYKDANNLMKEIWKDR